MTADWQKRIFMPHDSNPYAPAQEPADARAASAKGDRGPVGLTLSLVTGIVLGIATWAVPRWMTGNLDPLAALGWGFFGLVFLSGILATLFCPRAFWPAPLGVFVGQVGYVALMIPPDSLNFVSPLFWGWPVALLGALACHVGWRVLRENVLGEK